MNEDKTTSFPTAAQASLASKVFLKSRFIELSNQQHLIDLISKAANNGYNKLFVVMDDILSDLLLPVLESFGYHLQISKAAVRFKDEKLYLYITITW